MSDEFLQKVYENYLDFGDVEYLPLVEVALGLVIFIEEWWYEAQDGIYPIVLQRNIIPLIEDDEAIFQGNSREILK